MTLTIRNLLMQCLAGGRNKFLLSGQVAFYLLLLALEILLVDWYKNFYDAITEGNWNKFIFQIAEFSLIISLQAVAFGFIANISELMDVSIKVKLVNWKLQVSQHTANCLDRLEQRLIEDSLLIANKLSGLAPATLFNIVKIISFCYILIIQNEIIIIGEMKFNSGQVLLAGFILTTFLQITFAIKGKDVISKTENIKRKAELKFRRSIRSMSKDLDFHLFSEKYTRLIYKTRKISARSIGGITTLINLSNSISFLIPFLILFQIHEQQLLSIGDLMKIAAIYSSLSNSSLQILNSYSELFKLKTAIQRLVND